MKRSGLQMLEAEMARQHADALASMRSNGEMARRIAGSMAQTGRLLLLGMGASHYANRVVEPLYRELGAEAWASSAAEALLSPLPPSARTVLIVSQSGESGEILQLLERTRGNAHAFGLTLDPTSSLGRSLPCLVGAGGGETAFAATRSLLVTLALQSTILTAMGGSQDRAVASLENPQAPSIDGALGALAAKSTIVVSGRGVFRGLAETGSLMLMELARMPALGFETGQFRHGPLELLSPDVGVILLAGAGEAAATEELARTVIEAGASPVIFDCGAAAALDGAITVGFRQSHGLAAVFSMLPTLQRLIIAIAGKKVVRVGEPIRSTKITRVAS